MLLRIGQGLAAIVDRAVAPDLVAVGIDGVYPVVVDRAVTPDLVAAGIHGIDPVVIEAVAQATPATVTISAGVAVPSAMLLTTGMFPTAVVVTAMMLSLPPS